MLGPTFPAESYINLEGAPKTTSGYLGGWLSNWMMMMMMMNQTFRNGKWLEITISIHPSIQKN